MFNIDTKTCRECGGAVMIFACIDDPGSIKKILANLQGQDTPAAAGLRPESRAQVLSLPADDPLKWHEKGVYLTYSHAAGWCLDGRQK